MDYLMEGQQREVNRESGESNLSDYSEKRKWKSSFVLIPPSWSSQITVLVRSEELVHVFMYDFVVNGHWKISVFRVAYQHPRLKQLPMFKSSEILVDFIVDRIHPQLAARYIMPGILITIMTLTTLKLDPGSKEHLALGCLNPIIIHLLSIEDLNYILPQKVNGVPNIVLIYVNSFGLAIVALLLTIFFVNLRETKNSVPIWISSTISLALRHKIGQIVLFHVPGQSADTNIERDTEHGYDFVNSEHHKTNWRYVVALLN
ncbi:uncharacterized protein [Venturia canescens]|uniref:uncharacterized protein n=1 Tax=Venturia canescens TaxID=32260 RepID=UPI001C9BCDA8|nr:uncharacterized protein LOC122416588 [Venturia canescens]